MSLSHTKSDLDNHSVSTSPSLVALTKKNSLANESISRLYFNLALPMCLGMLINGLYNLVDCFFISRYVGHTGMAGVSIVFPLQMIIFALAVMISNGTAATIGRYLGSQETNLANRVVANAMTLALSFSLLVTLLVLAYMPEILGLLGVTTGLLPYAQSYILPIISGSILVFLLSLLSDILRAEAKMLALFCIILTSAILNVILDILLIAVLELGAFGAAIGTLIAQFSGVLLGFNYFTSGKNRLNLPCPTVRIEFKFIKKILAIGSPILVVYIGASLVIALINYSLAHQPITNQDYSNAEILIGGYGILGRINVFIILPLIAITNTTQTLIAYNFGAGLSDRVNKILRLGFIIATGYLSLIAFFLLYFTHYVVSLFSQNLGLILQAEKIAKIMFVGLPIAGIGAVSIAMFQAIGNAKFAFFISTAKIYLFLVPLILIINSLYGTYFIWYAFPIADALSLLLVIGLLVYFLRNNKSIFTQESYL